MNNIPFFTPAIFIASTLFTLYALYRLSNNNKIALVTGSVLLIIQGFIGATGFYTVTGTRPPHFMFLMIPSMVFIAILFIFPRGRTFVARTNTNWLIWVHAVRIPVEIVLFSLYLHKMVPELMTFEGRNPDILSGISALIIGLLYKRGKVSNKILLAWNIICLLMLINIVGNAVLSVPSPLQQFAFDQPNIAILYFPYVWLASFIVPIVLFAHLSSIYVLRRKSG